MAPVHPFELNPGSKARGWLEVAHLPGGQSVGIPWMAVRGSHNGPTLTISCGVHGDEYEGGEAIRQLWHEIDPDTLGGTWIGVPVVNIAAYQNAHRVSPLDGVNLNRIFPGDGTPSISGMVARCFFEGIVRKSDAVLDFHAGGTPLAILPVVAFSAASAQSRQLAGQTGIELLWEMPAVWSGSLCIAASQAGIPTAMPEIGENGRLDDRYVEMCRRIIRNSMIGLNMWTGEIEAARRQRVVRGGFSHCTVGGLFRSLVRLGEEVQKGQLLGTIRNVFGETLEELRSSRAGIVCGYRTVPPIPPGEQTFFVGEVVEGG